MRDDDDMCVYVCWPICPSVGSSVHSSTRPLVRRSVCKAYFQNRQKRSFSTSWLELIGGGPLIHTHKHAPANTQTHTKRSHTSITHPRTDTHVKACIVLRDHKNGAWIDQLVVTRGEGRIWHLVWPILSFGRQIDNLCTDRLTLNHGQRHVYILTVESINGNKIQLAIAVTATELLINLWRSNNE